MMDGRTLSKISGAVIQIAHKAIACYQTQDKDLAAKVIFHKRNIRKLEQKMREKPRDTPREGDA